MATNRQMSGSSTGGKRRIELYGNPGTKEGRKLGGLHSILIHKKKKTAFKTLKKVIFPKLSPELAELLGIFYGDGHVGKYQASIVTSSETDLKHAHYIKTLLEKLFRIYVSLSFSRERSACIILVSSKEACRYLVEMGMPLGNKIKNGIQIPTWIFKKTAYRRSLLRGLIDTDGCVYLDRHLIKGKKYFSKCIAFTSASPELLEFVQETLLLEGYHPTRWGRSVRLRRQKDVNTYAKTIGFNNPKHSGKIEV